MKLFLPVRILVSGLMLVYLLGCHERPATSSQTTSSGQSAVHVKEAKPGAAIKLSSSSIVFVNANELTQIDLLLDVKESSGSLNIELSATTGMEIVETQMQQSINLGASSVIKIPVKLRANVNGRYYLNIHASVNNNDLPSARNLAVIVQVGAETEKSPPLKKITNDSVISLPAQETISSQ